MTNTTTTATIEPTSAAATAAGLIEQLHPLMHALERLAPSTAPLGIAELLLYATTGELADLVVTKCVAVLAELELAEWPA